MRSLNKVMLIGNLGADPEIRRTGQGQAVATLRIATNEVWFDKDHNKQERTEWHRVILWAKLAELAEQYMRKGGSIYVEGRLQTRQWQDQQGQARYTTEVVGQNILLLGGGRRSGDAAGMDDAGASAGRSSGPGYGGGGGGGYGGSGGGGGRPAPAPDEFTDYEEPGPIGGEEDSDLPF
jgi:single-strand DNA-binding protein